MSELFKSAIAWKLAIFKGLNGWFTVVAMAAIAGLNDLPIDEAHKKIIIFVLVVLVAGNKFVDGFLDQTVQNIKRTQDPIGLGDTTLVVKQDK